MITAINFIATHLWWWIALALISFGVSVNMGLRWEKSSTISADRPQWMIRVSGIGLQICVVSAFLFVLSLVIMFLRAVFHG